MQDQGPQWDPISIDYHLPWAERLLILYLIAVAIIALVKSASILRTLYSLKWGSLRPPSAKDEFLLVWERCSNKVQSMKRLVIVTLLWTALAVTMLLEENLRILVGQKFFGRAAFAGFTVEALTVFALSILVCATLYTACALFEGALQRRRELWNQIRTTNQT